MLEVLVEGLFHLLPIALTIIAAVITRHGIAWLKATSQRAGIELSSRQEAYIIHVATQAVMAAEEIVEANYKAGLLTKSQKADRKLQMAMEDIAEKLPGMPEYDRDKLIHAVLNNLNLGASEFVGFITETEKK
jgi:hypothetical protein